MRQIIISNETISPIENKPQFILLGSENAITSGDISESIRNKINGKTSDPIYGFWGTLGMADNSPIMWNGTLAISNLGNLDSTGVTLEEIRLINLGRSNEININDGSVVEKFISFSDINFENVLPSSVFTYDEIPKLRLTIMLGKDEGALAFYHHSNTPSDGKTDDAIEYIMPEPTPNHTLTERDRLIYIFPIIPGYVIKQVEGTNNQFTLSSIQHQNQFVIKVLTFKRDNVIASNLMAANSQIHVPDNAHVLLKYCKSSNGNPGSFLKVDIDNTIDFSLKTLFLIHGTFSSTNSAFDGLIKINPTTGLSWLDSQFNNYGQIIGFDHPTIAEDAAANVDELVAMLGQSFTAEVDILTHSRGGLVGKYIAINTPQIPISKGALVACANGVGYFSKAWSVAKFLSILKEYCKLTGSPMTVFITGLAQYSIEYFLKMPGARLMTPGDPLLAAVADVAPRAIGQTKYMPIVGSFENILVQDAPLIKRWGEIGLNNIIRLLLGRDNDWVVGSKAQFILYPGSFYAGHYDPDSYINVMIPGYHTTYFDGVTSPQVIPKLNLYL